MFKGIPSHFETGSSGDSTILSDMLEWFVGSALEETFFKIKVDASLTTDDIVKHFHSIHTIAKKISDSKAIVVVFLDGEL